MTDLTVFSAAALLIAFIITGQNFVRYLRAADWNGVLGIVLACGLGVVAVWVAAQASVTDSLVLVKDGPRLGLMDGASLVLLGIAIGSAAPVGVDVLKAIDRHQTSAKPKLVPPRGENP
jgi:hypothetical protein